MARLSLRELSERIGKLVSYNALAKYENGEMMPGGTVLAAIAAALNQPLDFFFRSRQVQLADINFRKRLKLPIDEEEAIIEASRDFFERYAEVEELLGCAIPFINPFPSKETVTSEEGAERLARELRAPEMWNLGGDPLPNVHELIELHGIKLFEAPTKDEAFDGFSGSADGEPIVVVASWLDRNLPRKRMTEVHELAHILLRVPANLERRVRERIMNRFAGAFLLPAESFQKMFGGERSTIALGELIQIKAFFGVSIMAIMKRAEQLDLITPATFKRFCIFANQQKWRTVGEPGDETYCGDETHSRFRQLVFRAVAENNMSSTRGAALLNMTLEEFRGKFQQLFS